MRKLSKLIFISCTLVVMTTCKSKPQPQQIKGNYPQQYKLQENPKA